MKNIVSCKPNWKNSPRNSAFVALALLTACAHTSAPSPKPAAVVARVAPTAKPRPLSTTQIARLQKTLDSIFLPLRGTHSLCVLDGATRVVYDRDCTVARTPASTQKLIVAATTFHNLGAAYRFHTLLAATNAPSDGVLHGDLWLVGSGDPVLVSNDLRGGIKRLNEGGLRAIDGRVCVDSSVISGPERNPLWDPTDVGYGFDAATSGVSLDQDTIELHVRAGIVGGPAHVFLEPPSHLVRVNASIVTANAATTPSFDVQITGENQYAVRGEIPGDGHERILYLPLSGIPHYVNDALALMLQMRGIAVRRASCTGVAPSNMTVLWRHASPPVSFLVKKMLYESNNHIAEQLLRTIGRKSGRGDDLHGVTAELAFLRSAAMDVRNVRLIDGSGLSDSNRLPGALLASILAYSDAQPGGNQLYLALPRAGVDGWLRHYPFTSAFGRVRAKSGHLSGVDSLAGYVTTRDSGRLIFAFILNGAGEQWQVDPVMAKAVDRLAEF